MTASYPKINGHGHILPYPEDIPTFMKENEVFWIGSDRKYMYQKDWSRPITDRSFFLNEKREWMEKHDIDHAVMLTLSQLYCNGMERQLTADAIRFQNDFNGAVQASYPKTFTCGFVVQPAFLDDALVEIDRCVHELNMSLLCLPTHYMTATGQWRSVADDDLHELYQLANDLDLALEIHPYDGPKFIHLRDEYWRFHLVWMMAQTADTYHRFTLKAFDTKYPKLRTCFAHGNQFGQVNVGRRVQGFLGRPDLFVHTDHPQDHVGASNVFFDTLVHDVLALELLIKRQGISQVLIGLDDPYPLGEMETVPDCYPGCILDHAIEDGIITEAQKRAIWSDHVLAWLGGRRAEEVRVYLD